MKDGLATVTDVPAATVTFHVDGLKGLVEIRSKYYSGKAHCNPNIRPGMADLWKKLGER